MLLTDIDSRAAIRGSRDPLGFVPVWGSFGRRVVGNLTTVTGSVRGFTTTLLSYHFARAVQEREGGKGEATLGLFLKFEQLAAYWYYARGDKERFRGLSGSRKSLGVGTSLRSRRGSRIRFSRIRRSCNLAVEREVLLSGSAYDLDRVEALIEAVVEAADDLEARLLKTDEALSAFREDLNRESDRV